MKKVVPMKLAQSQVFYGMDKPRSNFWGGKQLLGK